MADTKESLVSSVHEDPNFAVICSFLTRYGSILGFSDISFEQLEKWISDTRYVNESLREILVRLLKRWKSIKEDRWIQYLVKFCHTYSQIDAWELEEFGFERCKTATKLRILKNLLECQFDVNVKFKEKINALSAHELRCLPLGRDIRGKAYWCLMDNDMNMRIYCEEQDDVQNETWQIIVSDREQLLNLIASLQQQKSHPEEKSRSATPSTIASDVLGIDGNSQSGGLYSSEASLDALPPRASIVKAAPGSDERVGRDLLKIRIKLEVAESAAVDSPNSGKLEDSCSAKSEVEEASGDADEKPATETGDVAVKTEQNCDVKPVMTNDENKDSTAADNKNSLVKDTDLVASENVVDDTGGVASSNLTASVTDDKKDCKYDSNIDSSENVPTLRDVDAEISGNGQLSETDKTHVDKTSVINDSVSARCDGDLPTSTKISSPQRRMKKILERPGSTAITDDAVPKSSGKRKRASLGRTLSTSSSEDGGELAPHLSESELSDSTAPGSRTQSAGEEEPPMKRKRDKALKTVAQRDRKFIKARVHVTSRSPSAVTPVAADEDNSNDGRSHTNEKASADDSVPEKSGTSNSETNADGKGESDEAKKTENENQLTSEKNEDERSNDRNVEKDGSATGDACVQEHLANDKVPTVNSSSVKEGDEQEPPNESDSSTVCDEAEKTLEASDKDDSKTTEDLAPSGDECRAEKKLEVSEDKSAKSATETENVCNGHSDETVVVSEKDAPADSRKSEAVDANLQRSTENGVSGENEAGITDGNVNSDATNGKIPDDEDKSENEATEKSEVDGKASVKKRRGGSKKRKGQKKRGHAVSTAAAPTSEVGETDYEPTKKIGRPAGKRKTRVAQIIAEGTDSVTQSEDDVPLSSLKKDDYQSDDNIPLIELRRSSRANKGQRKLDEAAFAAIIDLPKKRNRKEEAKQRKLEAKQERMETRRKRDAELQEQAALKAKKKKRGKSDSDDDFVPGKKNGGRKGKGRGGAKGSKTVSEESESGETTDDLDELFEAETEEEVQPASSSSEHLDSDGSEYVPRGRNAKRAAAIKQKAEKAEAEHVSDQPCIRCGKANQPEWILLCDRCDAGYHSACLRPPIMVVPEDDWFCPICEHAMLIEKLQEQLNEFDQKAKENVRLMHRKERLAFVTVNISNVIKDADRRAALKAQVGDLFDDEGSDDDNEEQPSPQPKEKSKPSTGSWRKRQRKKREFDSSLFSSTSEEEEDDEEDEVKSEESERSNRRQRKRREWDVSSGSEETHESWSFNRRSRRQRKQISYKFEEYDELLNAAIEEDVKEEPEVKAPPRRSGKDMSNITGVSESSVGDETSGKRKKRGRQLTRLDSDDTEADDDSEEFQLSEDEQASSADEDDDAGDNGDEDLSDDWSIARGTASSWKKTARSSQRRRRPTRFKDFVNDDSEEENSDDQLDYRRPRAAAQRRVNYHEISESDSSGGSDQRPKARKNTSSSRQQQRRRRNNSDSEYQPSSDAEVETVLASHVVAGGRHKRLGGSSDEAGSGTVTKKKGRLNRILSSSESESEESDDVARRFVKSRTEPAAPASTATSETVPSANCSSRNVPTPPVVNGKHGNDAAMPTICNAASENNKGFTIANLLKDSSTMLPVNCNRPQLVVGEPDPFEDSLSGIEDLDLVSYVTQT